MRGDSMKPFLFKYDTVLASHGKEIADAAKEMNDVFTDGYYLWLAGLYDAKIGGFYYANSARDNEGFLPDIESTGQALGTLVNIGIGLSGDLPPKMKEEILRFTKSLEDPDDGYFYHPQWGKNVNPSRRGRDLNFATGTLRAFGAKADYPTAFERIAIARDGGDNTSVPEHLRSKEAFLEWLREFDICTNSYPKGHALDSQSSQIKAAGLGDVCIDFINTLQRPDTGLWEDTFNYQTTNGMLKISTLYPQFGREFPNVLAAVRTQIRAALSDEPTVGIVDIYNPWVALGILYDNAKAYGTKESFEGIRALLREYAIPLLRVSRAKLLSFRKEDGSFSYLHESSSPFSQGVRASMGENEGDVNATALAWAMRAIPFRLLEIDAGTPTDHSDRVAFFRAVGHPVE